MRVGLSTGEAISRLVEELKSAIESAKQEQNKQWWKELVRHSVSHTNESSVFPWTSTVCSASISLLMLSCGLVAQDPWIIFEALALLILCVFNVFCNIGNQYLAAVEMQRRLEGVLKRLEQFQTAGIEWANENYPHLHTPLTGSAVLQWSLRDGHKVNLPWALLVENDLIYLKPGQVAPGRCQSVSNPSFGLNAGDIFHVHTDTNGHENASPIPEFKPPVLPQLFRLQETPYLRVVKSILGRQRLQRPTSRLMKYQHLFFVQLLCHWMTPIIFLVAIGGNVIRFANGLYDDKNWFHLGLEAPVMAVLPLISLSFPISWIFSNYIALSKVLLDYLYFRHVHVTEDPFDDTPENQQQDLILEKAKKATSLSSLKTTFLSSLLGRGEFLSRTENLIHSLGSITALCCTDKKGILSWPNTSAEKLFILKDDSDDNSNGLDDAAKAAATMMKAKEPPKTKSTKKSSNVTCEILTFTHDHRNPFKMDFDDQSAVKRFMTHLKPLGLAIMLNTCNISTEEKYTNFFNHLVCESMQVEDHFLDDKSKTIADDKKDKDDSKSSHQNGIEMLPIVTRGCLCELAKLIGFKSSDMNNFAMTNQIQTFRHIKGSSNDAGSKFVRKLHLARLKFPFPHMVSVEMGTDRKKAAPGDSHHLISQGTADLVLDSCIDAWTGNDLEPLHEDMRKKILDFYQRASLSSYCTAFSYRPLTLPLPWSSMREYLELPSHSLPYYWQYSENAACAEAEAIQNLGHISAGTTVYQNKNIGNVLSSPTAAASEVVGDEPKKSPGKSRVDAMACLELECNQSFLGMVQLQYQALVDVVQLIDLLEKACIRFVHFSKENELRSRVFSEKMGLESGWNCHISLRSTTGSGSKRGSQMRRTVSYFCPETNQLGTRGQPRRGKKAAIPATGTGSLWSRYTTVGTSLPDKLDRHPWFLDFPKWHENRRDRRDSNKQFVIEENPLSAFPEENDFKRNASRQASVTSDSDPFDFDMTNRAQLPKGIENIRPHLESMDNVPLLVSLFTDCTPDTTREMVIIMQDYGEVVGCMGSAANYQNINVFLQSDVSLAIEPLYPQVCQNVPVFNAPRNSPSPTKISQMLLSVASSLSFSMEDEVSIFHLILESRHFNMCLLNAMQFWTSCQIFLTASILAAHLFSLPKLYTMGQTIWLSGFVVPMLSLSLLGPSQPDSETMNISTGKNSIHVDQDSIRYALWCYGLRFFPTAVILVLAHGLSALEETTNPHFNMVTTELYLIAISVSFLFRARHFWKRSPRHNMVWIRSLVVLIVAQVIYSLAALFTSDDLSTLPSLPTLVIWLTFLPIVVGFNEAVKRCEIKGEVRYQKRQRLEFGTKLGINSPF